MSLVLRHGDRMLPSVCVDAYNAEIPDGNGFLGDRASNRAFRALLDTLRRQNGGQDDPLGPVPAADMKKGELDRLLNAGTPQQRAVMRDAVDTFAATLAGVVRRFLDLPEWADTERIVIGGGLRDSRVGERVIDGTRELLRTDGVPVELVPIRHHPDEAGLLGGVQLAPGWVFKGHDCILAMDIGGTNVRAGLVLLHQDGAPDGTEAAVDGREHWRHRDDKPDRAQAVAGMTEMLHRLIRRADRQGYVLAPFLAIGCPGVIAADGSIDRGGQNLPGDWEQDHFNLVETLNGSLPRIDGHRMTVAMHNDAVVQGLSEVPFMQDVTRWGVMTIGTGLGNARFTNRP